MFDFVTADNAEVPHVKVVYRLAEGDEQVIAEFFISDEYDVDVCEHLAQATILLLNIHYLGRE